MGLRCKLYGHDLSESTRCLTCRERTKAERFLYRVNRAGDFIGAVRVQCLHIVRSGLPVGSKSFFCGVPAQTSLFDLLPKMEEKNHAA